MSGKSRDITKINIVLKKGGIREQAEALSKKLKTEVLNEPGDGLNVVFDKDGTKLSGFGLTYRGDFSEMLHRVCDGRLLHEMLVKAAKCDEIGLKCIDATAGMGEDSLLLASAGYEVTLFEQNPVTAELLKDAVRRAKKVEGIKDAANRMNVICGDSIEYMNKLLDRVDLIYLDPMFPESSKTGLINKKMQLIRKMELPCGNELDLFEAAIKASPKKIIVKRPLKSPFLANKSPNYSLEGKAIRYDIYQL